MSQERAQRQTEQPALFIEGVWRFACGQPNTPTPPGASSRFKTEVKARPLLLVDLWDKRGGRKKDPHSCPRGRSVETGAMSCPFGHPCGAAIHPAQCQLAGLSSAQRFRPSEEGAQTVPNFPSDTCTMRSIASSSRAAIARARGSPESWVTPLM